MSFFQIFIDAFLEVWKIARVVIPLMIFIEILKDLNILDRISKLLTPVAKTLGISDKSTLPLVIGLILGLSYGAGVIIKSAKEGDLSKKDLYLLMIFLIACHSVIEDTLIFVTIGANGWLLLGLRLTLAVVLTILVSRNIDKVFKVKNTNIQQNKGFFDNM